MRKRMAAVLGALFLLVGYCLPAAAVTDVSGAYCEEAVMNLEALGIVTAYEDGTFREAEPMTRAEFASIVVRALGMEGVLPPDGQVRFDDVPQAHWAYESIMAAVRLGLMDGFSDTTFAPEENLSYEQAAKVLTCLTGYRVAADGLGGYPTGYNIVAGNLRLMRGITASMTSDATRGDLAVMLFRAMQVDVLSDTLDADGGYELLEDNTLLGSLLEKKDWEWHEGQVTANSITGLDGSSDLRPGQIEIDGQMFDAGGLALDALLGMHVQYYYSREEGCLTAAFALSTDNDELVLEGEDILSISTGEVVYEREDKEDRELLQNGASILYNQEAVTVFDDATGQDLIPVEGTVRLLDTDGDGAYNVVMIEDAESFVVESVSVAKGILHIDDTVSDADFHGKSAVYLKLDDSDYRHFLYDADGTALALSDIQAGDVISVIAGNNEKYIEVTRLNDYVDGSVEEVSSEGIATIDGEQYEVAKDRDGNLVVALKAGDNGRFYLSRYGRIFATKELLSDITARAYVIADRVRGGVDNALSLKLVAPGVAERKVDKQDEDLVSYEFANTELLELDCETTVRYNGVRTPSAELYGSLSGLVIEYRTDSDGMINRIDTLSEDFVGDDLYFNADIPSFGGVSNGGFRMDETTTVFCVPSSAGASDDDYFAKVTLEDGVRYAVTGFAIEDDTFIADAVVLSANMSIEGDGGITTDSTVCMLTGLARTVDEEGNEIYKVGLLEDEEERELVTNGNTDVEAVLDSLAVGDLICYTEDAFGRMNRIKVLSRIHTLTTPFHTDERGQNEQIFGQAYEVRINTFSPVRNEMVHAITVEDEGVARATANLPVEYGPPVFLYDKAKGRVSVADVADIGAYENVGSDADRVFIALCENEVRAVVIFE